MRRRRPPPSSAGRSSPSLFRRRGFGALIVAALVLGLAQPAAAESEVPRGGHGLCPIVDDAAAAYGLPAAFLTRVLWQESRFRAGVTSPAGAEGVAQFMPQTAAERGLADPWDAPQAIVHAARFLGELERHFGNLGLAAAAYNAGGARLAQWLGARAGLPAETRLYVAAVTGRQVEEWAARGHAGPAVGDWGAQHCLAVIASLMQPPRRPVAPIAVWQARLDRMLAAAFRQVSERSGAGSATVVSNRRPVDARSPAETLCQELRQRGAACAVYDR